MLSSDQQKMLEGILLQIDNSQVSGKKYRIDNNTFSIGLNALYSPYMTLNDIEIMYSISDMENPEYISSLIENQVAYKNALSPIANEEYKETAKMMDVSLRMDAVLPHTSDFMTKLVARTQIWMMAPKVWLQGRSFKRSIKRGMVDLQNVQEMYALLHQFAQYCALFPEMLEDKTCTKYAKDIAFTYKQMAASAQKRVDHDDRMYALLFG